MTWEQDRKSQVVLGRKTEEGDAGRSNNSDEMKVAILLLSTTKVCRYFPNIVCIRGIQSRRVPVLRRRKISTNGLLNARGTRSLREECHTDNVTVTVCPNGAKLLCQLIGAMLH